MSKSKPKDVKPEDIKNAEPMTGPEYLEQHGITAEFLVGKLKEELEACETKVFSTQTGIAYSDDLIAWHIRQKARMDAHKLRGDYPAEKSEMDLRLPNAMALVVEARKEKKRGKRSN